MTTNLQTRVPAPMQGHRPASRRKRGRLQTATRILDQPMMAMAKDVRAIAGVDRAAAEEEVEDAGVDVMANAIKTRKVRPANHGIVRSKALGPTRTQTTAILPTQERQPAIASVPDRHRATRGMKVAVSDPGRENKAIRNLSLIHI